MSHPSWYPNVQKFEFIEYRHPTKNTRRPLRIRKLPADRLLPLEREKKAEAQIPVALSHTRSAALLILCRIEILSLQGVELLDGESDVVATLRLFTLSRNNMDPETAGDRIELCGYRHGNEIALDHCG